jgi:hypothetical protein
MKTTMKIFAALTIMFGLSISSFAQVVVQNATNTIAANATVVGAISVAATQSLEFGNLSVSGPKTIDLAGTPTGGVLGGNFQRQGIFTIQKGENTSVDLTFTAIPNALSITASGGTAKLPIAYDATWGTSLVTGVGGIPVSVVANTLTTVPQNTAAPTIYVHLGGTVTPGGTGAVATIAGVYTADVTLKAEFN